MAKWKGKIIGGGIGFMFGGPFGAILGTMAGNFFDKSSAENEVGYEIGNLSDTDRSFIFTTHLVGTLMSVAKADGQINRREVDVIERTFVNFGFTGNDLDYIKNLINKLSCEDINLQEMCYKYKTVSNYNERLMLLRIVYLIAFADNVFHRNEDDVIKQIVTYLDINIGDASRVRAEFVKNSTRNYKIFGLSENASKEEVDCAYRTLSKKYHPDKVAHLGEEFTKLAHDKFRLINKAYTEIKKERGY
ncbi:MAG: TerB family tellurite resistance protein [Candidatus Anammoxibacter sp.]